MATTIAPTEERNCRKNCLSSSMNSSTGGANHVRMQRELKMLSLEPPHGICAWPKDDQMNVIEAQIKGPEGTPFEGGVWTLNLSVPERYPFEPPKVHFVTPIYHPNIDSGGRICLDTLKMPPKGSWRPAVNLSTLLTTIRLLIATPNADDGLMPDITNLYKTNPKKFAETARKMTQVHAKPKPMTELKDGSDIISLAVSKDFVESTPNDDPIPVTVGESEEESEEEESEEEESEEEESEEEYVEPVAKRRKASIEGGD